MHNSCHCCGLIHAIPELTVGQQARCTRCRSTIASHGHSEKSSARTAAAALGAFIIFWPVIRLLILQVDTPGHPGASRVLRGPIELISDGSWCIGGVALLFLVVFSLVTIVMPIELSLLNLLHRKHRSPTYHIIRPAGKWSMLDGMLLAFLVMLTRLGKRVPLEFGLGFAPQSIGSEDD